MNTEKRKIERFTHIIRRVKRKISYRTKSNFFALNDEVKTPKIHKSFVINLDRQHKRWKRFKREAKAERTLHNRTLLDYCVRVPAVDGKDLKSTDILPKEIETKYELKDHYFVDPDPLLTQLVKKQNIRVDLSQAEVAVALSHLKVWKQIVEKKIPYALIFEDDIAFDDDFANKANKAWEELPTPTNENPAFDILYFSYNLVANEPEKLPYSDSLYRPVRGLWWLSAYVVSYEGAQKLLNALPIIGPVDMWINLHFPLLDVFATNKSIIGQRKDWKSDNEYSIIPLLTKAGIQNINTSAKCTGKKPIFAIGMNKTATTSLHFALRSLGYRSCHFISHEFSDATSLLIDNNDPLQYEAYTDIKSVVSKFRELDKQYPTAVFILTTRDLDSWIASRSRHVQRNKIENAVGASYTWTVENPEAWKLERKKHHDEVLAHFKDRPDKLLVLDICGGDAWEPLCNFLACPIPDEVFPHVDPLIKLDSFSRNLVRRIPLIHRKSKIGVFDSLSWVKRPKDWSKFTKMHIGDFANRTGTFSPDYIDNFEKISPDHWVQLNDTFVHNLAQFQPRNINLLKGGGFNMELSKESTSSRKYTAASICTKTSHLYGRFEAKMKPTPTTGTITALFLYRYDPWQEIDLEFFGKDTTKIMVNIYYNPGKEGIEANEGVHGTPVVLNLGFDAAEDYHRYAIEWDPKEVRWFVDDQLVHVRLSPSPSPIPDLPMKCYFNIWSPNRMKELAGDLKDSQLPVQSTVSSFVHSSWIAPEADK